MQQCVVARKAFAAPIGSENTPWLLEPGIRDGAFKKDGRSRATKGVDLAQHGRVHAWQDKVEGSAEEAMGNGGVARLFEALYPIRGTHGWVTSIHDQLKTRLE
jgi:hypothetical protein